MGLGQLSRLHLQRIAHPHLGIGPRRPAPEPNQLADHRCEHSSLKQLSSLKRTEQHTLKAGTLLPASQNEFSLLAPFARPSRYHLSFVLRVRIAQRRITALKIRISNPPKTTSPYNFTCAAHQSGKCKRNEFHLWIAGPRTHPDKIGCGCYKSLLYSRLIIGTRN